MFEAVKAPVQQQLAGQQPVQAAAVHDVPHPLLPEAPAAGNQSLSQQGRIQRLSPYPSVDAQLVAALDCLAMHCPPGLR